MRAAETSKHEVSEVGCIFGSSIPIALAGGAKHVVRLGRQIHFGEKTTMRKLTIATLGLMLAAFAGSAFARPVMDDTATDTTKTKTTKSHKKKTTDTTDTTVTTKATKAAADTGKMASDTGKMAASDTKMAGDKMASTAKKATTAPAAVASSADIAAAKASGKVWVNKSTKVYHTSSSKYYGATKSGAFMTEADAKAAGYHAAKNGD
jgi:hypothetical protein